MKYLFAFLLVLLVACSQAPAKTETPPAQVAPAEQGAVPQPVVNPTPPPGTDVKGVVTGTDKTFGTVNSSSVLKVDDVKCDRDKLSITFRFVNNDNKDWQMNQQVAFGDNSVAPVHVFVNGYEANGNGYTSNGVRYFGPNEKFSENCGGIELLKPGADITCTIYPVPLRSATSLSSGVNEIFIDSPTSHHKIQFTC